MDLNKHIVSDANKFDNFIKQFCITEANNYFIPNIKKVILDNYDSYLIGNVVDKNSRTNPINYRDEFLSVLNNFNFIVDNDFKKSFIIRTPGIDNFNWNFGRLNIIRNILEGISGVYVEVDEVQYTKMYNGRKPYNTVIYDNTVSSSDRIFLIKYTADVMKREKIYLGKDKLVRYPFSNAPPFRLFESADTFVNNKINNWISDCITKASNFYYKKGVL